MADRASNRNPINQLHCPQGADIPFLFLLALNMHAAFAVLINDDFEMCLWNPFAISRVGFKPVGP
jgi:hypothetical protein